MQTVRPLFTALLLCTAPLSCTASLSTATVPAAFDKGIHVFVSEMTEKHGFDAKKLGALMSKAHYRQSIIDAISRPAEAKPWHQYRPIFVTDARARGGLTFWDANEELLQRAEQEYGVPPEIIVAIIGVETRYGQYTGKYPLLDALATLAFGYPKRGAFFRQQLEEALLLMREEAVDPVHFKGSYAGAMGKPQFIPSSYRAYAVDFDGDGRRDLLNNNADVIGSVANYFRRNGWRQGEPITSPAQAVGKAHQRYLKAGMKPSLTIGELRTAGITPSLSLAAETLSSLIRLEAATEDEYWLGLHNFYVITRYNHSNLYAMAVYQLSRRILALRTARKEERVEG